MTPHSLTLHPHEVRAALDGRLGLVVRPVKPQPFGGEATYQGLNIHGQHLFYPTSEDESVYDKDDGLRRCPLCVPGTKLVCKEKWAHAALLHYFSDIDAAGYDRAGCWRGDLSWRSPATMPAWASRVTLEVVGVRCVRAKELTEDDARAWGSFLGRCSCPEMNRKPRNAIESKFRQTWCHVHGEEVRSLWESKYAPRYPWETSWAWAVGVGRVEG